MLPEQNGLLASLFTKFRRADRGRKKRGTARAMPFARQVSLEQLEDRRLLVTHVFLDFGDNMTVAPPGTPFFAGLRFLPVTPAMTVADATVGTGAPANFAGTVNAFQRFGLLGSSGYTMVAFGDVLNNFNPTIVNGDAITIELAITAQIQRALAPYDVQVISSAMGAAGGSSPFGGPSNFAGGTLAAATAAQDSNDIAGDGISPTNGTAVVPQFGSADVYVFIAGYYSTTTGTPVASPMSAEFAVAAASSGAGKPFRLDSGAMVDGDYWIDRVAGASGTGGSLNVAIANAAMYTIGFDFGVSEVENGITGPFTNFNDSNVQLINQSNAMVEAGFNEGPSEIGAGNFGNPISDTTMSFFPRFPMMQDGVNPQEFLRPGTLGNPPLLFSLINTTFPTPAKDPAFFFPPDSTLNETPTDTVNSYDQLINDPDIGPNPDVAYVTGTGAFDQIFITKINATQARVTVNAYADAAHTKLITTTDDGLSQVIGSYTYTINLTKVVTPGRADDGKPFMILVDGCTSGDQIFLDPTLGVNVDVEGGPGLDTLFVNGNGMYTTKYTPNAPGALASGFLTPGTGPIAQVFSLIPEGLLPAAAGTLAINGSTTSTTTTKSGTKTVTKTVSTPFTTTVSLEHFNPVNGSALRLENFSSLTYASPGFLNNEIDVTALVDGTWQIAGQVDSPFFPPGLNGNLQFANIKQLSFDTTRGTSSDTLSFATNEAIPAGLQSVNVNLGTGVDSLNFDDSKSIQNMDYVISPTLVQPVQTLGSTFLGFSYVGVDLLSVTGTAGDNKFSVSPSKTTSYSLDGGDPPDGTPPPDGDILSINLSGTSGASPVTPGAGLVTFTDGHQPISYMGFEQVATTSAILALAASSDNGAVMPLVKVNDANTDAPLYSFDAYPTTFKGGVRVAVADVTGPGGTPDGVPDVIVAPGPGRNDVRVYDGSVLATLPQDALHFISNPTPALSAVITDTGTYTGGLYVAAGDVTGDGAADIITSRSRGTTMVRVYQNNPGPVFGLIKSFAPYAATITTGAAVAAGDINGDGVAEVITTPGTGVAVTVKEFNGVTGGLIRQFAGFEPTFKAGVSLAVGDLDGDGFDEIVLGAGAGGTSRVRVLDGRTGALRKQFQAYTTGTFNVPLRISIVDQTGAGFGQLLVSQGGIATQRQIRGFDPLSGALVDSFFASDLDFRGGINVG